MTRRNSRKYLTSRRLGVDLWGGKDAFLTKNYPPGQHGSVIGYKKLTDYGVQLQAKQKIKKYYGNITEKQFRRIYAEAVRRSGNTSQNLVGLLESRLDAFVYRAKFAPTVFAARQIINHKHIKVNGKMVNIPSYVLKQGDLVEVREKSRNLQFIRNSFESTSRTIPHYVELTDRTNIIAMFKKIPELEEIPYPSEIEPKTVVEFYSK